MRPAVPTRALVVSDAASTYRAMSVVRCLREAGLRVFVLSAGRSMAFPLSRFCSGSARCHLEDLIRADDTIVDQINLLAQRWAIDVVVPVDLQSVLCVGRIRARLRTATFPVPPPDLVLALNDKWTFAGMVRQLGLDTPTTIVLDRVRSEGFGGAGPPFVVKPRGLEAGVGVRRFSTPAAVLEFESSIPAPADWLLQGYIPGEDIDFSALVDKGRVVASTAERRTAAGRVEFVGDAQVRAAGNLIVSSLELNGAVNIDMRRDSRDRSLRVIECNPLLWDTIAAPAAFGMNIPFLGVQLALGRAFPSIEPIESGSWVTPRRLIKDLFDGDRRREISRASWSTTLRTISDPVAWLFQLFIEPRLAKRGQRSGTRPVSDRS